MMLCGLTSVLLGLFLFSKTVDARTDETLIIKIYDADDRASDAQMAAILKKADLEGHGYKRELTTSLVSESGDGGKPRYRKKYFYYKSVNCSRAQEVIQELQTLLSVPGGVEVAAKTISEIKAKKVTEMKQCKVGLEIHYMEGGSCAKKKDNTGRRKRGARVKRLFDCWFCKSCRVVEAK